MFLLINVSYSYLKDFFSRKHLKQLSSRHYCGFNLQQLNQAFGYSVTFFLISFSTLEIIRSVLNFIVGNFVAIVWLLVFNFFI